MRPAHLIPMLLIALTGCDMTFKPGAESILDAVKTGPTPAEMAKMAVDPYDPNARCMGTLDLSAESFAGEPVYIKLFEDNLKDPDPSVRAAAARGLGNHGEPVNAPQLATALSDKDRAVRVEAARGLQRIHNDEVIDALAAAMKTPDPAHPREGGEPEAAVRTEAALALGQYAQPRVLETLMTGLDDPDLSVNDASLSSLRVLTGQDFGYDHAAWVDWRARTQDYFVGRGQYVYPYFHRSQKWYEYLPFVPGPPNEAAGTPAGMPRS